MKIKEIKVWSVDLGNTKPYTIAFKTIDEVRNAFRRDYLGEWIDRYRRRQPK